MDIRAQVTTLRPIPVTRSAQPPAAAAGTPLTRHRHVLHVAVESAGGCLVHPGEDAAGLGDRSVGRKTGVSAGRDARPPSLPSRRAAYLVNHALGRLQLRGPQAHKLVDAGAVKVKHEEPARCGARNTADQARRAAAAYEDAWNGAGCSCRCRQRGPRQRRLHTPAQPAARAVAQERHGRPVCGPLRRLCRLLHPPKVPVHCGSAETGHGLADPPLSTPLLAANRGTGREERARGFSSRPLGPHTARTCGPRLERARPVLSVAQA